MRNIFSNLAVCLGLVLLLPQLTKAQWVETNVPNDKSINAFAVNGSNIFVGTAWGGVFRSIDSGANWSVLDSSTQHWLTTSLVVKGNVAPLFVFGLIPPLTKRHVDILPELSMFFRKGCPI